ncbi:MAG: hypothetical protein R3325_04525 [Thermoanaerobaculia bacterium]|nr:hypothetical protein [Thermoanaerobaculia bacterium]
MSRAASLAALLLAFVVGPAAAVPACSPCAGFLTDEPREAARLLAGRTGEPESGPLFVGWRPAPGEDTAAISGELRRAGATPWLVVALATPPPLLDNLAALETELEELARRVEGAGPGARVQVDWRGAADAPPSDLAFLIKRAAVAVTGAEADAEFLLGPLAPAAVAGLFDDETAPYLDGVAIAAADAERVAGLADAVAAADPGAGVSVVGLPASREPLEMLAEAARLAGAGAAVSLFDLPRVTPAAVAPFLLLAREFAGDIALDPYSVPAGASAAWSFVRGEDLGLRVVAVTPPGAERLRLEFPDGQLSEPRRLDPSTGETSPLFGLRVGSGYEVEIEAPAAVEVVALDRIGADELTGMLGVAEEVTVEDIRQIPVGEILRRLQAFEDAQRRKLRHYRALNTTHLRFQAGTAAQSFEATLRGDFFFRQGEPFDWAWRELLFNGVRWRSKRIPELPLLQPEKAAALPVEISFTRQYRYRLRGTGEAAGRDCWVVDFEPEGDAGEEGNLYQGTVWVDREIFARVRTRAVQLGLKGDVISNEETVTFEPLDASGQPAPWAEESFFLPVRLEGQQIWSLLSTTPVVEREIVLSEIEINGDSFDAQRQAVLASEVTMVRDTEEGLRFLKADGKSGERVVEMEPDPRRRFLVGGIFYDESQDFPIPLAGINWLWFDFRGTGAQANVFFAGALFNVAITDPSFLGSRWDAGVDVFGLAIAGSDTVFRDGREVPVEEVEFIRPNVDFKLGRPLGSFGKLALQYELGYLDFSRADDTAADFATPSDTLTHRLSAVLRYNRAGYRLRVGGARVLRDEWEPWGFPGNPDYDPGKDEYTRWEAGVGKTWHFPNFLKLGAEIEYVDGSNLDRFSKYEFGIFSDVRVRGYQSDKVRAEKAWAAHLSYGFDLGSAMRLELLGDAAWATDEATGLEDELLGGAGIAGFFVGPWNTLIRLDLGVAVAGPDDSVSALVTVLKLFGS